MFAGHQLTFCSPKITLTAAYDATGAGAATLNNAGAVTSLTWTHTPSTAFSSGGAVIIGVAAHVGGISGVTASATYGGTAMTQLGTATNSATETAYQFGLLNPPTTAQTVTVTFNKGVNSGNGNSVTYKNVNSFGTTATANGNSTAPSISVTASAGPRAQMVAHVFAANENTITAYSQTSRSNVAGGGSDSAALLMGDAPGAATVTFGATISGGNNNWAAVGTPLLPGNTYIPPTPVTGPTFPSYVLGRGTNVVPTFNNAASQSGQTGATAPGDIWESQWTTWTDTNYGWTSYYTHQIDNAATLGNCIRFWCNNIPVTNGNMTQTTFNSYLTTALNYIQSKGLYVYVTGTDFQHIDGATYTQLVNYYTAIAEVLSGYSNVVGMDISNEINGAVVNNGGPTFSCGNITTMVEAIYNIVSGTYGIPCGHSISCTTSPIIVQNGPYGSPAWHTADVMPYTDFMDYHLYYQDGSGGFGTQGYPSSTQVNQTFTTSCPWQSSALNKHVVIGEWGNKRTDSDAVSNYDGILDCINNSLGPNGERVKMVTTWSCWDIANADMGLYNTNGYAYATNGPFSLRTDGVMTVFDSFPMTHS